MAQKTAQDAAREVTDRTHQQLQDEISDKLSKSVENITQTARTEASEIAWQKVEESQKLLLAKIAKAKAFGGFALVVALAAVAGALLF